MDTDSHGAVLLPRQKEEKKEESASISGIISTLIPVVIIATIVFVLFLLLRGRVARVYQARTLNLVPKEDRIPPQKKGLFGWISDYKNHRDITVMQRNSFDGYLMLRFFKLMVLICVAGCLLTWPILFPINATGGKGAKQLDILSFSNVPPGPRYFAHAVVACAFLGMVVFLIFRERLMFIGLRQAYSTSPFHSQRLSARTLLILHIPMSDATEPQLRQIFGANVRRVWIVTDCNELEDMVDERDKAATKLENAQVKLIKSVNSPKNKDSSNRIDPKSRPTHRLKPLIGKKVDTIDWAQSYITKVSSDIGKERNSIIQDSSTNKSAAFIEFVDQAAARQAIMSVDPKKPHVMAPRYIGVQPEEIIWKNLGMKYPVRKMKELIAVAIITLMIIFWTPIVAFAGAISAVFSLAKPDNWLSFLLEVPSSIRGVITGLLPALVIIIVMMLPPIIARLLAKQFAPTVSRVELKCQKWYFAFQVVQVFLVVTLSKGVLEAVQLIIDDPTNAPKLLAQDLPKASNLYLSFYIIQGITGAALMLLAIAPLLLYIVLGSLLDKTPRKKFNRWVNLAGIGWGSVYPKFTLLGVIAITYSCIAPLVLGFAAIGLFLMYLGFRYAFIFVLGNKIDMKGDSYAMALQQLLTGVYIASLCLLGLFLLSISEETIVVGPLVLMVVFLVAFVILHLLFNVALRSLESMLQLEIIESQRHGHNGVTDHSKSKEGSEWQHSQDPNYTNHGMNATHPGNEKLANASAATNPPKLNFLARKLKPLVWSYYEASKDKVGRSFTPEYTAEEAQASYLNPAMSSHTPLIWLPRDRRGLSRTFVAENREKGLASSDEAASLDEKNKVVWDRSHPETAPIWKREVVY